MRISANNSLPYFCGKIVGMTGKVVYESTGWEEVEVAVAVGKQLVTGNIVAYGERLDAF